MAEHIWTGRQREIVGKLLAECESESRHFSDRNRFRKRNFSYVDEIDLLVQQGFIEDRNLQYSVNFLSLLHLETDLARKILSSADALWLAYRQEFQREDHDEVFLSTAAKIADVEMEEAQRALHYMLQGTWHRGFASPAGRVYSSIQVGEDVLRFDSFTDWLEKEYKQYSDLRALWPGGSTSFPLSQSDVKNSLPMPERGPLPVWVGDLPEGVQELLREISQAKAFGWNRLAAMGIRALFDLVSIDALSADAGAFKKKLDDMLRDEHIAPVQRENLDAMVDAGSAAAHRGFNPTVEMVETMWGIALNTLESFYVLGPKARKLKVETPARPNNSSRKAV